MLAIPPACAQAARHTRRKTSDSMPKLDPYGQKYCPAPAAWESDESGYFLLTVGCAAPQSTVNTLTECPVQKTGTRLRAALKTKIGNCVQRYGAWEYALLRKSESYSLIISVEQLLKKFLLSLLSILMF